MADDIVTRLRNIVAIRGDLSARAIPNACTDAANEIEQLRQRIEELEEEFTETVTWLHSKIQKLRNQHISWDTLKEFKTLPEALLEIQRLRTHIALSNMVAASEDAGMYPTDHI